MSETTGLRCLRMVTLSQPPAAYRFLLPPLRSHRALILPVPDSAPGCANLVPLARALYKALRRPLKLSHLFVIDFSRDYGVDVATVAIHANHPKPVMPPTSNLAARLIPSCLVGR